MTNNPTIDGVSRELMQKTDDLLYIMTGHDSYQRLVQKYGQDWWVPINELRAEICTLLAAPAVEWQEPVLQIPEECPHLIVFDDADRENLMFSGTGARESAMKTWEQISLSWNAHLFVRVERNSRDDRYPSATATALQSTIAHLEARIAELESGRGEPVAWKFKEYVWATGLSDYVWRDQLEDEKPNEDERQVRDIAPLFTAPPAPVAVVPEGWKLVPVEATRPMLRAFIAGGCSRSSYRDMIAAAPICLDATAALNEVKS